MYRTATIAAFDVMGEVHIAATVRLYDSLSGEHSEIELHCSTRVQGVGSSEGRDWLRDALVGLVEAL